MCIAPVTILNPNYGGDFYTYEEGHVKSSSKRLLYTDYNIKVPCGKCIECKRTQYSSYLQRVQIESMTSYVYMITLTYDDNHIPSISFTSDDGMVNIYYSDIHHVQTMFKRLRKYPIFLNRDFRYIAVTEYGSDRFRPHHHLLLFVSMLKDDDQMTPRTLENELFNLVKFEWRVNVGSKRCPLYEPLFTYRSRMVNGKIYSNYDLHLVTADEFKDTDDVGAVSSALKYIISYMLKPNEFEQFLIDQLCIVQDRVSPDIFRRLRSILYTRVHMSKHLGFGFSNGHKVMPSLRYMRSNVFNTHFWQVYQKLPLTEDDFLCTFNQKDYNDFQDRLLHRVGVIDFQHLFSTISPYELTMLCALYKYQRSFFATLIHRYKLDLEVFSMSIFPLTGYDSSYKDSIAYKTLRKYVDVSHASNLPFIGFRCRDTKKDTYLPMCNYFKKYVCVEQDYINWLDRVGADTLSELDFEDSHVSKVQSLASYNIGISQEHLSNKLSHPFKNLPKNFEVIKNSSIFAPSFHFLMSL